MSLRAVFHRLLVIITVICEPAYRNLPDPLFRMLIYKNVVQYLVTNNKITEQSLEVQKIDNVRERYTTRENSYVVDHSTQ